MAVQSPCGLLANGQDASCVTPTRRYFQQAVVVNKTDILSYTVNVPTAEDPECVYTVGFTLKEGKTGYRFAGSENGSVYKGYFDKSTSDLGQPQYIHNVQMLVVGADQESKCVLDSLGRGSYVVALQLNDTIEIYGMESGLVAGDYTYDLQEGGGGTPIVLSSLEVAPEGRVPFVFVSSVPGSEVADFDDLFANPAPSV
jgi:hypothetical protein